MREKCAPAGHISRDKSRENLWCTKNRAHYVRDLSDPSGRGIRPGPLGPGFRPVPGPDFGFLVKIPWSGEIYNFNF